MAERIAKFLARSGLCSRRQAEEYIKQKELYEKEKEYEEYLRQKELMEEFGVYPNLIVLFLSSKIISVGTLLS